MSSRENTEVTCGQCGAKFVTAKGDPGTCWCCGGSRKGATKLEIVKEEDWRDRCDWCGWPLKKTIEEGCVSWNCSQRPMPKLGEVGELHQEIRRIEKERDEALETVIKMDANMARLLSACEK